jgi:RecB family exonuclease
LNSLLSYLDRFCGEYLLDEKVFIVPSYQIGNMIGLALAMEGRSWVNLRFMTLSSLAEEAAGEELAGRGLKRISGTTSRLLIHRIFQDLKESGELRYYGELEVKSGIVDAVCRSIYDLRMAGIKSNDLDPEKFIDKQKGKETRLFLEKYEEELEQGKYYDAASLFQESAESAIKNPQKEKRHYLCLDDQVFSKVEMDFLESLKEKIVFVPHGQVIEREAPRRLKFVKKVDTQALEPQTNLERAPWIFSLKDAPPKFKDDSLQMFQTLGPSNECREVLKRIFNDEILFDQVEVIHPGGSEFPSIFFGLLQKIGVPFTSAEGFPIGLTAPGKVYDGILRWMENGYPASDLCALLEGELLKTPEGEEGKPLSPLKVSRAIKEARIGWGRDRYVERLEALYRIWKKREESGGEGAERSGEKKEDGDGGSTEKGLEKGEEAKKGSDKRLKDLKRIINWIRDILEPLPSWDEGEIGLDGLCAGISSFLKKRCRIKNELDGETLGILTSRLDEAASFKDITFSREEALEWLASLAANLRVGASGPSPGAVFLSPYPSGGFSGRPYTFIVGLDQGSVPGTRLPDPILLDEERERISGDLELSSDRLRENLRAMTALLSSLRGKAVLSFSSYDVIEDRPSFPSSFLLQVHRLIMGDETLDYSSLMGSLGQAAGFIPEAFTGLDETEWWLEIVAGGGKFKDAFKSVADFFPFIAQGDYARRKRYGPDLSSYDGLVQVKKEEFHPCFNPELRMSASRVEMLARCPYSYYLRYVLDIQPPDEVVLDRALWLDAMQRGTLLHDIFCAFMREIRERGEKSVGASHWELLRDTAEGIIARFREETPPPSEAVFEREKRDILAALEIFFKTEQKRERGVEPLLFEVNFGVGGEKGEGVEECVPIHLGEGASFRLAGRIDRIDRIEGSKYKVIDYKTGSYTPFEGIKAFGRGKHIQHVLYAEAAEAILRELGIDAAARVSLCGYAFPTRRGDGREILFEGLDRKKLRGLLISLFSVLENGRFLVNSRAVCDFCDYGAVCGTDVIDRTKEKMESNEGEFAFFTELEEYE